MDDSLLTKKSPKICWFRCHYTPNPSGGAAITRPNYWYNMGKPHGLPVEMDCLVKKGASAPQAESASLSERRKNVTGACACYAVKVAGKRVLLCDVATSGITLSAYTIALKEAGAAAAHGLTVTREI